MNENPKNRTKYTIMTETENGYRFKSSGRELITHGCDLISVSDDGGIYTGYDQGMDLEPEGQLTDEEKTELAQYMILKWAKWAGISEEYL